MILATERSTFFCNRRHTRIKILYFDGTGLWVLSKRLERGTFSWPKPGQLNSPKLNLTPEALAMRTDGVDLRGARMRPQKRGSLLAMSRGLPDSSGCVRLPQASLADT